jgi:hypothetical protein
MDVGSRVIPNKALESNMVEVECPLCTETVDLGSDTPGAYECPYCNRDFEFELELDDKHQATLQIKEGFPILGLVFMWGFTIVWCAASLFATVFIGSLVMSDLDTTDWTPVDGVVTNSSVSSRAGSEGGVVYCLNVDYEYTIDGTTYQGNKISYSSDGTCDSSSKNSDEDYPEGKEITVYVNPSDHSEAVLETGLSGVDFVICLICVFPLVGLVLLYGSAKATFGRIKLLL